MTLQEIRKEIERIEKNGFQWGGPLEARLKKLKSQEMAIDPETPDMLALLLGE